MQHHVRPAGPPPPNGYSHAVSFTGPTVVVSGQVPLDADGRLVGGDDTLEQTRQVFRNIETALAAAGASMSDVVKLTIFLTNVADLPAFRAARDEFIDLERPPASSLVQVAALVHPGFRVEVEALAVLPTR
ncbi:RidA family protein [Actinoplanes sp. LDG1-06]|uniref:RidA family protein n=1 Tax=Paractinoplanes ovalisporus TaxID=2810368 RepID=A0ABS2ATE1_9ACTN|nr:RidA family protein [Actinoplanes ovalisporus]MBM2622491.1 RidA family protein [Actinoplanes ovalisporus]